MGADFKEKTKRSFTKCWDKAAVEANTPNLFSRDKETAKNHFEAEPIGDTAISIGTSVVVRPEGGELIGRQGLSPVLKISNPTKALSDAIATACEVACADVVAFDSISGMYEVTIY